MRLRPSAEALFRESSGSCVFYKISRGPKSIAEMAIFYLPRTDQEQPKSANPCDATRTLHDARRGPRDNTMATRDLTAEFMECRKRRHVFNMMNASAAER